MSKGAAKTLFFVFLFAVLSIIFSKAFVHEYSFDSYAVIFFNPAIQSLDNFTDYFLNPFSYSADPELINYRPILLIANALNYKLGELNVAYWHVIQIIIHFVNCLGIFVLSGLIGNSKLLKLSQKQINLLQYLTTLYFALHPLNATAINYLAARSETLMVMFLLPAVILGLNTTRQSHWLSIFFYSLAVFTKETAVIFLPLIFLLDLFIAHNSHIPLKVQSFQLLVQRINFYLSLILISLFYLFIREMAMQGYPYLTVNSRGDLTGYQYFINQIVIIPRYVFRVLLPVGLSTDYYGSIIYKTFLNPAVLLCAIASFCALLLIYLKRSPSIYLILSFLVILAPTSSFLPINDLWNEHRQYFANYFIQIILVYYLITLKRQQRMAMTVGAVYIIFISLISFQRGNDFLTDRSYWRKAVSESPSERSFGNYAIALTRDGQYAEAEKYFYLATQVCQNCTKHQLNAYEFQRLYYKK